MELSDSKVKTSPEPIKPTAEVPKHIAIIMDGNGRWAQSQDLPRIEGHRRGVTSVRTIVEECTKIGVEQLTLYCFSSENWKRPKPELDFLMHLLQQFLIEERALILEKGLRFSTIGRTEQLSEAIQAEIKKTQSLTVENTGMNLCLAINYGSRGEIVDAIKSICQDVQAGELPADDINEETVANHLNTAGMPDPDLVIRTAGEMRVSNFLLWQLSYSELWVTQKCWPEFREVDLHEAIDDFSKRQRRYGGLNQDSTSNGGVSNEC